MYVYMYQPSFIMSNHTQNLSDSQGHSHISHSILINLFKAAFELTICQTILYYCCYLAWQMYDDRLLDVYSIMC